MLENRGKYRWKESRPGDGSEQGIGFEISRQLGRHGFTVVLAARDEKKVGDAAARLQTEGLDAHGVVLDVANPSSAEAAARLPVMRNAGRTRWERNGRSSRCWP